MASRYGGYDKLRPNTRALEDFTLTPYVEEGDTLLYIAQYPEGWELYTAKTPLPMLVLSCEEGSFNIFDPEMPDPLRATLDNLIAELKQYDSSAVTSGIASSDNLQANDNIKSEVFVVNPDNSIQEISESDLPPGHWVVIGARETDVQTSTSPKLTKTKWGQWSPWNTYAKWLIDPKDGKKKQAPAGCTPVAIAQYTYYTHFKDGIPKFAAASAKATSDGMDYTFPLYSMTVWNQMAYYSYEIPGCNEVALLIGSVGRELNSTYKLDGTSTTISNIENYLTKNYSKGYEKKDYFYVTVMQQIDMLNPVLTCAWSYDKDETVGHTFIIDQYSKTVCTMEYTWGWERDPLPPGVTDIWLHDKKDSNGNIIDYAYKKTVISESVSKFGTSMNWGWNGSYDNIMYYDSNKWEAGGYDFTLDRILFLPK